ncbi:hypothetical protein TNCV_4502541 [Trichonephila clavipes]|nr:hypothetical protein TNCV_4502541 [Trichonephila clavipes]
MRKANRIILVSKSKKMTLTLQIRALLVKLFYLVGTLQPKFLLKFRSLKRLQKGSLSSQGLTNMIRKFEARPQACTATGQQYALLLEQSIIPALQASGVIQAVFMQNGALSHIARWAKQALAIISLTTESSASTHIFQQLGLLDAPT